VVKHRIIRAPVEEIYADFERNFRDPLLDYASCLPTEGYDHATFLAGDMRQGFFEDIYYNGVQKSIVVVVLTASQAEDIFRKTGRRYKYRVVQGHRRFWTVEEINRRFPGHIAELDLDAYSGLSELAEWEMLSDHGGTRSEEELSELGQYRAVVTLYAAGFSQERIAQVFGQKRGWSMRRIWIHLMGTNTPIERHYVGRFHPDTAKEVYVFPISDVDKLHRAWTSDTEANVDPMASDAAFARLWNSYEGTGRQPKEEKSLTRKQLDERAAFVAGRPALEEFLRYASGRGGNSKTAAEMYDKVAEKAARSETLATEAEELASKLRHTDAELFAARDRITALEAENLALKAELATLHAEIDSVKSGRKAR
jgi:hypothetical protein